MNWRNLIDAAREQAGQTQKSAARTAQTGTTKESGERCLYFPHKPLSQDGRVPGTQAKNHKLVNDEPTARCPSNGDQMTTAEQATRQVENIIREMLTERFNAHTPRSNTLRAANREHLHG